MFDRFEDDCKRVMNEARREALRLGHNSLDAEHIVLGLLLVPDCAAMRMLDKLGCDVPSIRSRAEARITVGKAQDEHRLLPFTSRSKRVLELSMDEAGRLGDDYIGTEHVLVGYALTLEKEGEGRSSAVLGCDPDRLRSLLDGYEREGLSPKRRSLPKERLLAKSALSGSPEELLRLAVEACDKAKQELVMEQRFDQASRLRDLAHWLRTLADDIGGKASS